MRYIHKLKLLPAVLLLSAMTTAAYAAPAEREIVIPAGEIQKIFIEPAPRITSLDGKTVVLRWNGKNNGDVFLDRLAELLAEKQPKAKVVKAYANKELNVISGSADRSDWVTKQLAALKPDLLISMQAD